ncbi:MAG: hypothetical protein U5N58_11070 [Actinomycetota bacterium]|nr:hypothetical protein [Actinomycetota bacterium]
MISKGKRNEYIKKFKTFRRKRYTFREIVEKLEKLTSYKYSIMEHQQQKAISGTIPGDENNLEHTLGYEQVAVDLTCGLAELEKDKNVKAALDFALLEDFDHLYRYSNFLDMHNPSGRSVEDIIGKHTEVMPEDPTFIEHTTSF